MNIPTPMMIDVKHWEALIKSNTDLQSIEQMMNMFQQKCQERMFEVQQNVRATWSEITKDNPDLNIRDINWAPGKEPGQIVPVSMRFQQ